MNTRQFIIAAACITAAFVLAWYGKPEAAVFLALIGGSPLTPHGPPPPADPPAPPAPAKEEVPS